jgi:hypothetical protein
VPTPQDEFWEQVRETNTEGPRPAGDGPDKRLRPEASPTVVAVAQRLDRRPAAPDSGPRELGGRPDSGATVVVNGTPVLSGPQEVEPRALPAATSRLVDTAPVVDTSWDRLEEPILVPSRADRATAQPRPADVEMVGGRPVFVVYRPSRGLEMGPYTGPHPDQQRGR